MERLSTEQEREELERIYNPPPPLQLIYKIFIFGTIGTFLAVLTVRVISPSRLPLLKFPEQSTNQGQNND